MHRFRATLYKIGNLRCVDLPARASGAFGPEKAPPVRGTIEGIAFRSTLLPRGEGAYRMFVHSRIWRTRGLDAGDATAIAIERDDEPRADLPLPRDFVRALEDRPVARAYAATIAPSLRREIAAWLAAAKRAETRERRIMAALDRFEEMASRRRGKRRRKTQA